MYVYYTVNRNYKNIKIVPVQQLITMQHSSAEKFCDLGINLLIVTATGVAPLAVKAI